MEGITLFFNTLWEQLDSISLPIIEITFSQFLLGVFAVKIAISVFNYLLSKSNKSSNDKSNGD